MRPGEDGAVVVEALIAALIVAGLAAALFATLRTDAAAARGLADRARALLVARSVLAAATAGPAATGARAGTADGLAWRLAVRPLPAPDGPSALGVVEEVVVTVRAPGADARPLAILPGLRIGR